jgi:hypothetical protein
MRSLVSKFLDEIKKEGFTTACQKMNDWLRIKIFGVDEITKRRIFLSNQLNKEFNGVIRYGPFKGFKFIEEPWWGVTDRASMLLGIYEQEILSSLQTIPPNMKYLLT